MPIYILVAAKINVCGVYHAGRSDHGRQTGLNGILSSVIQKAHLTTNLNPGSCFFYSKSFFLLIV